MIPSMPPTPAQNLLSFFAESVSTFDEFAAYCAIVGAAEDAYMPGGPRSARSRSAILPRGHCSTCALPDQKRSAPVYSMWPNSSVSTPSPWTRCRTSRGSYMGMYEHVGRVASRVRLRELVTGDVFECHVAAGYLGKAGELWYVRRCPHLRDLFNYHIIFTTPYVLTETSKADWTAYLNKSILETGRTDRRTALYEVLKYGREPRFWSEFIFLGYHHHQPDAIFLAGLPDVKGSLPHAH